MHRKLLTIGGDVIVVAAREWISHNYGISNHVYSITARRCWGRGRFLFRQLRDWFLNSACFRVLTQSPMCVLATWGTPHDFGPAPAFLEENNIEYGIIV
eukprot:5479622-Pyramimonas_sp.AAC.1